MCFNSIDRVRTCIFHFISKKYDILKKVVREVHTLSVISAANPKQIQVTVT